MKPKFTPDAKIAVGAPWLTSSQLYTLYAGYLTEIHRPRIDSPQSFNFVFIILLNRAIHSCPAGIVVPNSVQVPNHCGVHPGVTFALGESMPKLSTILHTDHFVPRRQRTAGKLVLKLSTIRHHNYVLPRRETMREWYRLGILVVGLVAFWLLVFDLLHRIGGIMP